jgi:hypothetical protein
VTSAQSPSVPALSLAHYLLQNHAPSIVSLLP